MSKLTNLIRRVTRVEPAPMGFGSAARKPSPTMLLVALVGDHWTRTVGDAVGAGADALLLTGHPSEKELSEAVSAAEGRPCGLLAGQASPEEASQLGKVGLDFLVLTPETPASALQSQEVSFLIHLKEELTDIQLRTLDPLPLEAIYLDRDAAPLTIRRQMELQRLTGLARKPLVLSVRPTVDEEDLLCLRDAGVALIALDLKERDGLDALRRLRGVIDALPPRRRPRRDEAPEVLLPRAAAGEPAHEEEEGVVADP